MATANVNISIDSALKQEAETKAALDEYEEMKKNPGSYKRYESFDEALDEVFADA
ncbi:MAG: hypothetical protein K2N31_01695 [Treponemataceae bacterium]|nr:hypothetical protein [Treponemataceae bacterium]MDE7227018.1 hypothetical protein [Treponemataceae bacterium]